MLKIALRNVFRNRRRTTLSLLLIALGTASLFIVGGYIEAGYVHLKELSAATYGHLQIAHGLYWKGDLAGYRYLITPRELTQIGRTLAAEPELDSYTKTLTMEGLIGNSQRNTTFIGIGVEPDKQLIGFNVEQGRSLQKGDLNKVFIGEQMAQLLNVKVGDPLVVMGSTVDGSLNTGRLEIVGFFKGPQPEQDAHLAFLPLSFVQRTLNTEGVEKLIIKLRSMDATDRVGERLKRTVADDGAPDFVVKTWSDLSTFYHQVRAFWNVMFGFMNAAIFTLVFFSILEVMTMSFFERMREIGTVRALGTKRYQVFTIFFAESVCLGLLGAVLGLGLGCVGGWLINFAQIMYSPPGFSLTVAVEIWIAPSVGVVPFVTAFISTLVSTIFPALRAARTNIVEALRHV